MATRPLDELLEMDSYQDMTDDEIRSLIEWHRDDAAKLATLDAHMQNMENFAETSRERARANSEAAAATFEEAARMFTNMQSQTSPVKLVELKAVQPHVETI